MSDRDGNRKSGALFKLPYFILKEMKIIVWGVSTYEPLAVFKIYMDYDWAQTEEGKSNTSNR